MNLLIYLSFILLTITNPIVLSQLIQIILFIVMIINIKKIKILKKDFYLFLWLFYLLFSLIFIKKLEIINFKTYIGYLIYFLGTYFYMKYKDINYLLNQYINLSILFCGIGIFQQIAYLFSIKELYDFNIYGFAIKNSYSLIFLRMTAFFTEPVHFGLFIIPAYYLYIYTNKRKKYIEVMYLVCIFLTFSLVNYFVFSIFLLAKVFFLEKLSLVNIVKKIVLLLFVPIIFLLLYISIPMVNEKLNSLLYYKDSDIFREGGSAYSIISLLQISWSAFKENIFFGRGFLSTESSYEKYILDYYSVNKEYISQDVFYFKLFGELGLIGVFLYILLTVKFYKNKMKSRILLLGVLFWNLRIGAYVFIPTFYLWSLYLRLGSEIEEKK